jgi:hypothetical protein
MYCPHFSIPAPGTSICVIVWRSDMSKGSRGSHHVINLPLSPTMSPFVSTSLFGKFIKRTSQIECLYRIHASEIKCTVCKRSWHKIKHWYSVDCVIFGCAAEINSQCPRNSSIYILLSCVRSWEQLSWTCMHGSYQLQCNALQRPGQLVLQSCQIEREVWNWSGQLQAYCPASGRICPVATGY